MEVSGSVRGDTIFLQKSKIDMRSQELIEPAPRPNRTWLRWLWQWFWRVNLVVSLVVVWYCFYVPNNNIAWAADYTSAQQQSAQSGKPLILYFTGKWCVPCRIMKRNVWADEQVAAAVNAAFIPVMIDMDDADADSAVSRYSIGGTPNTIITDPTGNVLQQKSGGMEKAEFLEMLGELNLSTNKGSLSVEASRKGK